MKRSAELPGAALVVWGALFFNWVLAFINAHGINISPSYVALCEILLMASAMAWVLKQGLVRDQVFVLLVYVGCFVFTLLRFAYAEAFDLKSMRDLAIIFVFICLGLSSRAQPYKLVYYVTLAIAAIGIVEILFPDIYYGLLNIKQYYINSRGFTEADFWNTNSDLFVSGTRPGERFFLAFTNWPRASSVFLEPVSLGNFIIVSLTVLLAGWKKLPLVPVVIWATTLFVLLLISDSRYAFACAIVLIAGNAVLRRIPQQLGFVLFFGVILAAGAIVLISGVSAGRDDFLGRLYYTFNSMNRLDLPMLLGFKFDFAVKFMDSGLLYFVVSQSLPVVVLLTVLYSVGIVATGPEAKLYKTCTLIAVALSLLISNSLFSIKVAALMWYCLGAFASASSRNKTAQSAPVNAEINLAGLQHSK